MSSREGEKIERIIRNTKLLDIPSNSKLMYDLIMQLAVDRSDSSRARERARQASRFKEALIRQANSSLSPEGMRDSGFNQFPMYYEFWARSNDKNLLKFFKVVMLALMSLPRPTNDEEMTYCYQQYGSVHHIFMMLHGIELADGGRRSQKIKTGRPSGGLQRLYELAAEDDEALSLVQGMYNFCRMLWPVLTARWYQVDAGARTAIEWDCPESAEKGWGRLVDSISMESTAHRIPETMHRLAGKRDEIVTLCSMLWEDIASNRRCLLRSGGKDRFRVEGRAGEEIAHRYFLPEANTGLGVTLVYERLTRWGTYWEIDAISPRQMATCLSHDFYGGSESLRGYATLTALSNTLAYRKIVCSQPDRNRKSYENKGKVTEQFEVVGEPTETVRAHFRKLRPGWNPSKEALALALAKFGTLPPAGHTIVNEFTRAPAERAQPSPSKDELTILEPLFVIKEDDILSWLE